MPSLFSHCWLGVEKSIRPVKKLSDGYWRGYLFGVWCKWFAYGSVYHCHLIICCFSTMQNGLPFWY